MPFVYSLLANFFRFVDCTILSFLGLRLQKKRSTKHNDELRMIGYKHGTRKRIVRAWRWELCSKVVFKGKEVMPPPAWVLVQFPRSHPI